MDEDNHENERLARIQQRLRKHDLSSRRHLCDHILCSYVGDVDAALRKIMPLAHEWCISNKEIDRLFVGTAESQSLDAFDRQFFLIDEVLALGHQVFGRNSPTLVRWLRIGNENLAGLSPLEHLSVYPGDLGRVVEALYLEL